MRGELLCTFELLFDFLRLKVAVERGDKVAVGLVNSEAVASSLIGVG